MIEWIIGGAALAAASAGAWYFARRKSRPSAWTELLEEVAERFGGRASVGGTFDSPELRAKIDELQLTLRLSAALKDARKVRAEADVALPGLPTTRLYFGWNNDELPAIFEHIEAYATGALRLEGHWQARSDEPERAQAFLRKAELPIFDLAREAEADAIEVDVRGGYLRLRVHGCRKTTGMLERVLRVTAELGREFTA